MKKFDLFKICIVLILLAFLMIYYKQVTEGTQNGRYSIIFAPGHQGSLGFIDGHIYILDTRTGDIK
jgi:hypothetical protein